MQGCPSLGSGVRVGACVQQKRGKFIVRVGCSQQECIGGVVGLCGRGGGGASAAPATCRERFVNARTCLKQSFDSFDSPFPSCKEKSREAAIGPSLDIRAASDK